MLHTARMYEEENRPRIPEASRPVFHVTGGIGWINDPNGFSYYDGAYHLFYQYHPYSLQWGPMHWGHVKSHDLIHWDRLPVALAPDMPYDANGCFSGSALTLPDGRHLLMYTGVKEKMQSQCLAVGDGVNYEKYSGNPVIEGCENFRDPKIWEENGRYYTVAVHRAEDGSGEVRLYESSDAFHWEFHSILAASHNQWGGMWECPDFFSLDGSHLLLVSVMDLPQELFHLPSKRAVLALIGHWKDDVFSYDQVLPLDLGMDFYAPQTLLAPDGRRILIGWLQSWDTARTLPRHMPWFGQMTLPRELSCRNGKLLQNPIRELDAYRHDPVQHHAVSLDHVPVLPVTAGADLTIALSGDASFALSVGQTPVIYDAQAHTLTVDHHTVSTAVAKLRCIIDRYSLEIFINDGENVISTSYCDAEDRSVRLSGTAVGDVDFYHIG